MTATARKQKGVPTAADIEGLLIAQEIAQRAASSELERLQADRERILLEENDAAAAAHDQRISAQTRAVDRATARIKVLKSELEDTRARESEADRVRRYNEAAAAAQESEALLAEYDRYAAEIARVLTRINAVNRLIASANDEIGSKDILVWHDQDGKEVSPVDGADLSSAHQVTLSQPARPRIPSVSVRLASEVMLPAATARTAAHWPR